MSRGARHAPGTLAAAAVAALIASGCGSNPRQTGLRLDTPTALVEARMVTGRDPATIKPYLVMTSAGGNELRVLDPIDNQPVLGPGSVFPLSIPTEPRPLLLAATRLGAAAGAVDSGADLLVVASGGVDPLEDPSGTAPARALELVATWPDGAPAEDDDVPRVAQRLALDLATGEEIVALAAAPIATPPPAEGEPARAPRARLVVAIAAPSGGRLLSIEFERVAADGRSIAETVPPARTAIPLDFTPVALAFSGDAPDGSGSTKVYCATRDDLVDPTLGTVRGVAEVDLAAATVRVLPARAGTVAVRWARVAERRDEANPDLFAAEPVDRVYAILAPEDCGRDRAIDCGVVAIDPQAGALAADPASELDYRAPLTLPALANGLAVALPPAAGAQRLPPDAATGNPARMRLAAGGSSLPETTAVGAVPASDGETYVLDLGRWTLPNDVSMVRTATRVRATTASTAASAAGISLGLFQPDTARPAGAPRACSAPAAPATLVTDLEARVLVTPGYTRSDRWTLAWQGVLPGLAGRRARIGLAPTGEIWVALVSSGGAVTGFDPRLAVLPNRAAGDGGPLPGDLVAVTIPGDVAALCAGGERAVAAFADAAPPAPAPAGTPPLGAALLEAPAGAGALCPASAFGADGTGVLDATVTVRAPGLLLTGAATGYAGRPATPPAAPAAPVAHDLEYVVADDRAAAEPTAAPVEACALGSPAFDRVACERQLVSRRARRFHYPSERCDPALPACEVPGFAGGRPVGPALALCPVFSDAQGNRVDPPADPAQARGAALTFATQSGLDPMSRAPDGVSAALSLPIAVTPLDRSVVDPDVADVGRVLYVTYSGDLLYELGPGRPPGDDTALR